MSKKEVAIANITHFMDKITLFLAKSIQKEMVEMEIHSLSLIKKDLSKVVGIWLFKRKGKGNNEEIIKHLKAILDKFDFNEEDYNNIANIIDDFYNKGIIEVGISFEIDFLSKTIDNFIIYGKGLKEDFVLFLFFLVSTILREEEEERRQFEEKPIYLEFNKRRYN